MRVSTAMPCLPPSLPCLLACVTSLRSSPFPRRTTFMLVSVFWLSIDRLADASGLTWSEWATSELVGKPVGIGAARWLRVRCLIQSTHGA
jgi:hypothetical protein